MEGDWLRGQSGAGLGTMDRRSTQMLAPSHSLSLPLFCSVCISVSEVKTTQEKERRRARWKGKGERMEGKEGVRLRRAVKVTVE